MPFLNVEVSQDALDAAREASGRAGMLLKRWVERAVKRQAEAENQEEIRLREQDRG